MKHFKILTIIFFAGTFFGSCQFVGKVSKYRSQSIQFMENLMAKQYDKCVAQMVLEQDGNIVLDKDTAMLQLDNLQTILVNSFTRQVAYTFIRAESPVAYTTSGKKGGDKTYVYIQMDNKRQFGVLQFVFEDSSGKLLSIKPIGRIYAIPDLSNFWLLGLIPLLVLLFNIYVIVLIKRSSVIKKWQKYLLVVLGNFPVFSYSVMAGIGFKLFALLFLGVAVSTMGYMDYTWQIGLPIGAGYVWWKLHNGLYTTKEDVENLKKLEESLNSPAIMPDANSSDSLV